MPVEERGLGSRQTQDVGKDRRLGNLSTPKGVQRLQKALHAKAKAAPDFRSGDPVQTRQGRRGSAAHARDHGQAEAHGQRGEDTRLQGTGRAVRLSGFYVWAAVFDAHGTGSSWLPAVEEKHPAHGSEDPCADRRSEGMARDHSVGEPVEPHVTWLGELLSGRERQPCIPCTRQLHHDAVASVVTQQA